MTIELPPVCEQPFTNPSLEKLFAAAREVMRKEGDGCVIDIYHILERLTVQFGGAFSVSTETQNILQLIYMLWRERHIDPISTMGVVEFVWRDQPTYQHCLAPWE